LGLAEGGVALQETVLDLDLVLEPGPVLKCVVDT
jgi:hypothetical protein